MVPYCIYLYISQLDILLINWWCIGSVTCMHIKVEFSLSVSWKPRDENIAIPVI